MDQELLQKALAASSSIGAAELHGMVCGMAAANSEQFSIDEFVQLAGTEGLEDQASVEEFVSATLDGLYASDMSFAPLVADDEESLETRLQDIANFSAGFLSGFGAAVGELATMDMLPQDVQEVLRDYASISSMDEQVEGSEDDESSFMELYEYVRVATVLSMTLMSDQVSRGDEPQ